MAKQRILNNCQLYLNVFSYLYNSTLKPAVQDSVTER